MHEARRSREANAVALTQKPRAGCHLVHSGTRHPYLELTVQACREIASRPPEALACPQLVGSHFAKRSCVCVGSTRRRYYGHYSLASLGRILVVSSTINVRWTLGDLLIIVLRFSIFILHHSLPFACLHAKWRQQDLRSICWSCSHVHFLLIAVPSRLCTGKLPI